MPLLQAQQPLDVYSEVDVTEERSNPLLTENEKNQKHQTVDSKKIYLKAHDLFHKGDYSSAIKFEIC